MYKGAQLSQQSSLKLSKSQGLIPKAELKIGVDYTFEKPGHRLYIIDTPLELFSDDWQTIGRIYIKQITIGGGKTKGIYSVIKIYSDLETEVISQTLIPYKEFRKSLESAK